MHEFAAQILGAAALVGAMTAFVRAVRTLAAEILKKTQIAFVALR
jgi:hypothetical protein